MPSEYTCAAVSSILRMVTLSSKVGLNPMRVWEDELGTWQRSWPASGNGATWAEQSWSVLASVKAEQGERGPGREVWPKEALEVPKIKSDTDTTLDLELRGPHVPSPFPECPGPSFYFCCGFAL